MGLANSKKLLELASDSKETEAIELLKRAYFIDPNYANVHSDGDSCLHLAATNNLIKLTTTLLSYNITVDAKNKYSSCALHIATRMGHDQIVRLLLKAKCNVNTESYSSFNALTIAASCNNLSIARLLLEKNAHIQETTLLFASLHPDGDEMCRILLNHGANVNATDASGNTALMQAATLCNERVVNVLVSREWSPIIEINRQNKFGWSALHFAYSAFPADKSCERAKANIINMLLKKGASMQLNNNDGKKPKETEPHRFLFDPPLDEFEGEFDVDVNVNKNASGKEEFDHVDEIRNQDNEQEEEEAEEDIDNRPSLLSRPSKRRKVSQGQAQAVKNAPAKHTNQTTRAYGTRAATRKRQRN